MILPDGMTADAAIFKDIDYVVLIGNAKVSGATKVLDQGQGYSVVQLQH